MTTVEEATPQSTIWTPYVPVDEQEAVQALAELLPVDGRGLCGGVTPEEYAQGLLYMLKEAQGIVLCKPADVPEPGTADWLHMFAGKCGDRLHGKDTDMVALIVAVRTDPEVCTFYAPRAAPLSSVHTAVKRYLGRP